MGDVPSKLREEYKILGKYKMGAVIDINDIEIVNELASVGLIRKGLSLTTHSETAITTQFGKRLFEEDPRNKG